MPTTDKLQYPVHKLSNTYVNKTRTKSYPMEKYYDIKEEWGVRDKLGSSAAQMSGAAVSRTGGSRIYTGPVP